MAYDAKLERYLNSLELALKPFPVSDRAEIIIEIRSHILSALEKGSNLDSVLSALGEPETVANKYLIERGLKTAKPPISPIVKWLVIGFLGSIAILVVGTIAMFAYLSPVVKVDERTESVSLFNGAIQVDGKKLNRRSGSVGVASGQPIEVRFGSGNVEVETSESSNFVWSCTGLTKEDVKAETVGEILSFDLSQQSAAECELKIPKDSKLKAIGKSGNLEISEPEFHVDAELASGNISFDANDSVKYKFDVKVQSGNAATFTSSDDPGAYEMKFSVLSGNIEN